MVKLTSLAATVVVGNPEIADVAMQDGTTAFVTGKGFGTTNVIAMDAEGRQIASFRVVGHRERRPRRDALSRRPGGDALLRPALRGGRRGRQRGAERRGALTPRPAPPAFLKRKEGGEFPPPFFFVRLEKLAARRRTAQDQSGADAGPRAATSRRAGSRSRPRSGGRPS